MKKVFLIYICITTLWNVLYGQTNITVPETGCVANTVTTNPDVVPGAFDWRTQNFTVYLSSQDGTPGVATTIVNPYFDQSLNPTTFPLANDVVKDFAPADGWELLYRSFGTAAQGVKTPFFVLYNKYNGTVRVFANIVNSGEFPYTAAAIKLGYKKPDPGFENRRQTAVLNQLGSTTFSMEELQKDASHFSPTSYLNSGVNNNYYWVYADFFALFDPCTCGLQSDWYLEVGLINNIDVNLTINGIIQHTMIDANPNGNPDETELGGFFGKVQQYLGFGSGIVDGINGILASGNEGKKKGDALLKNADSLIYNFGPIIGREKARNIARSIGRILFELPKVNMVMNLAKTLISTVKKLSDDYQNLNNPQSVEAMGSTTITEYKTNLTVSGTLTVKGGYVKTPLKVPGAQVPTNAGAIAAYHPFYDNILGVYNLFEQPKFELKKYQPDPNLKLAAMIRDTPTDPYYLSTVDNSWWPVFPEISQFYIKNPPKLVVNPAAGLTLKSVDYQIVFENVEALNLTGQNFMGPTIPGPLNYHSDIKLYQLEPNKYFYRTNTTDREKVTSSMGYELEILSNSGSWNGASISSPYLNQDCFADYNLFTFSTIKNPQLRVKAVFQPTVNDPNSTVKEVIIIHTFNGIIENVPTTQPYVVTGTPNLPTTDPNYVSLGIDLPIDESTLLFGYPSEVLFLDETIDRNIYAIGDLTIGNNVSVGTGNYTIKTTGNIYFDKSLNAIPANSSVNFIAGKEIFVSPEAIVSPEVVLSIDPSIVKPCETIADVVPTSQEIANFCNGPVYNARSAARSIVVSDVQGLEEERDIDLSEWNFELFPNPTAANTTIRLDGKEDREIGVKVTDIAGKEVNFRLQKTDGINYTLELENSQQGIYFVTVSSYGGSKTKQLIVQ